VNTFFSKFRVGLDFRVGLHIWVFVSSDPSARGVM